MKVLVACEYSGIVREAFADLGHDAWSCDLLETEIPGNHIKGDILEMLNFGWDLMIAHPPCTHLSSSGARHFAKKKADGRQDEAIKFFMKLTNFPIPMIAIENPIGIMSTYYKKPDQIIQPYQFGHPVKKSTCLWLKNLPKLEPTEIVEPELITLNGKKKTTHSKWDYEIACMKPELRGKLRSKTFPGIAKAMAEQWTNYFNHQS